MAHHVIAEFNLDLAHKFRTDPAFAENLYMAFGHMHLNNEQALRKYGIKVLNEHHSSDCEELTAKRNAGSELYEACKEMISALNGTYLDDKQRAKEHMEKALAKIEGRP